MNACTVLVSGGGRGSHGKHCEQSAPLVFPSCPQLTPSIHPSMHGRPPPPRRWQVANSNPTAASMSTDLYGMATLDACQQINVRSHHATKNRVQIPHPTHHPKHKRTTPTTGAPHARAGAAGRQRHLRADRPGVLTIQHNSMQCNAMHHPSCVYSDNKHTQSLHCAGRIALHCIALLQAAFFDRIDLSAHGFYRVADDRCGYDWDMQTDKNWERGQPFNYFTQGARGNKWEGKKNAAARMRRMQL